MDRVSKLRQADKEQAGRVCFFDGSIARNDKRALSLDSDTPQSGLMRLPYGIDPNCRQIGPLFLARLAKLYQDAARALASQRCASPQKGFGSLDSFDTKHNAILNDCSLPDIDGAKRTNDINTPPDIAFRRRIGLEISQGSARRHDIAQNVVDANDAESFLLL